jgi:hypothetical protein
MIGAARLLDERFQHFQNTAEAERGKQTFRTV